MAAEQGKDISMRFQGLIWESYFNL
jgi:hypothetical protein